VTEQSSGSNRLTPKVRADLGAGDGGGGVYVSVDDGAVSNHRAGDGACGNIAHVLPHQGPAACCGAVMHHGCVLVGVNRDFTNSAGKGGVLGSGAASLLYSSSHQESAP
jgi:hypothetical protein